MLHRHARLEGLLLGTAVGDALGLPREGLSPRRARRVFGGAPLGHRLIVGRGMISDDTEHACMTAQALLTSRGDPDRFAQSLAWRLRWWFAALPAGVGLATAKAILKLWIGFPPRYSGIYSAGNGPAMRAPVIGAYADDESHLVELVRVSTRITHTHPDADAGSLAIALAARCAMQGVTDAVAYLGNVTPHLQNTPMLEMLRDVVEQVERRATLEEFLQNAGLERGVGGYINHTVPAAVFCWLRWPGNFRHAVEQIILAGGDTDSTAAIVGALVGASSGSEAIPREWIDGVVDYPRSIGWIRKLAGALANRAEPIVLTWPLVAVRNAVFLAVVLAHGVRRLLPPY